MRYIVPIIILLAGLAACGPKPDSQPTAAPAGVSEYPPGAVRQQIDDIAGMEKVFVNGDQFLQAEGDYLNGLKHGAWVEYHNNGLPKSLTTYHKGLKQGVAIELSNRGAVEKKAYYHTWYTAAIKYRRCLVIPTESLTDPRSYFIPMVNRRRRVTM